MHNTPRRNVAVHVMGFFMSSTDLASVPSCQQVLDQLGVVGGLGGSLSAAHAHLCFAIKKSRESGLGELEGGLTGLQTELEGLIARLQPTLLFQAQQPV